MKAKKNENKSSAKRKLIPAVAMLTTSAIMLSTATYAWFTMNTEVEVKGINIAATVPASLQISLGKAGTAGTIPENTNESTDWNNIVSFMGANGQYTECGKLIPASSTTGNNIFYTENANGVGKTISDNAEFKKATDDDKATLIISGSPEIVKEGYYVDIPVYFRTSETSESEGEVQLSVQATFKEGNSSPDLYKAARVAILDSTGANSTGVIKDSTAKYYGDKASGSTETVSNAVQTAGTYSGSGDTTIYGTASIVKQTGDASPTAVVTVKKHLSSDATSNYGDITSMIIRVWLEGEDTECWNKNAGQDFSIDLKFSTITND